MNLINRFMYIFWSSLLFLFIIFILSWVATDGSEVAENKITNKINKWLEDKVEHYKRRLNEKRNK